MTNTEQDDLMTFLKKFQKSIEDKIEDTKGTVEETNRRIGERLDKIDGEMMNVQRKIETNEAVNNRMDERLKKLEEEMRKSEMIRRKSLELKDKERRLSSQEEETDKG